MSAHLTPVPDLPEGQPVPEHDDLAGTLPVDAILRSVDAIVESSVGNLDQLVRLRRDLAVLARGLRELDSEADNHAVVAMRAAELDKTEVDGLPVELKSSGEWQWDDSAVDDLIKQQVIRACNLEHFDQHVMTQYAADLGITFTRKMYGITPSAGSKSVRKGMVEQAGADPDDLREWNHRRNTVIVSPHKG